MIAFCFLLLKLGLYCGNGPVVSILYNKVKQNNNKNNKNHCFLFQLLLIVSEITVFVLSRNYCLSQANGML